jgi:hypothetical protein
MEEQVVPGELEPLPITTVVLEGTAVRVASAAAVVVAVRAEKTEPAK